MAGPTRPQQRRPPPLTSAADPPRRVGFRVGPSLAIGIGGVAVGLLGGLLITFWKNAPRPASPAAAVEDRPWSPLEDGTRSDAYRKAAAGKGAKPLPAPGGDDLPRKPAISPAGGVGQEADASAVNAEMVERQRVEDIAKQHELEARRETAFEDFMRLLSCVEIPTASGGGDVDGRPGTTGSAAIDLGPFAAADLVDPQFRLAVPRDTINGKPFVATIKARGSEVGSEPKWVIQYQPQDESIDEGRQKPRTLATLVTRHNRLMLEVPKSNELAMRPFALLRRSVILVEARDPAGGDAAPIVKEIRLVKPVEVGPFTIDPLGERQSFTIATPPGIQSHDTPPDQDRGIAYQFPVAGIEIRADLMGTRVDVQLPRDAKEGTDPGIGEWQVKIMPLNPDPDILSLVMDVKMSIREATLAVTPKFVGQNAHLVTVEMVRRNFIDGPEVALQKVLAAFDRRVRDCPVHDFEKARTAHGAGVIKNWFTRFLATEQSMGMTLPGHETISASFDGYVQERYAEEAAKLEERRKRGEKGVPERPDLPANGAAWLETLKGIKDAGEWKKQFSEPLGRWAAWFRPKFEQQWQEYAKAFAGALKTSPQVRIEEITSLAYDEEGKEYRVPLAVFGREIPAGSNDPKAPHEADQKSPQSGDTGLSPAGGGTRAGID
jgi:hypothetical protein